MKLSPINPSTSFDNTIAERFADITVDKIINGETGYAGISGHIRRSEDLENLCTSHPGNLHLIEKYAECLTYVAETAWRYEEYKLIADSVRKVRELHSAYPESTELNSIFIFSLIWDAKRTFRLWGGKDEHTICDEYGIEPPEPEDEEYSDSIDYENKDDITEREEKTDEDGIEDEKETSREKSCWVKDRYNIDTLENHLKILASDAKTALELYPDETTAQLLYADLLSEIIFDYYWEQYADSVASMESWNAKEIYEMLKTHYEKYQLPEILEKLMEGAVYLIRQYSKDEYEERDIIRCEMMQYLSEIKDYDAPELHGMYARICASEISDCTGDEHIDFCKEIMKKISDLYSQHKDEENVRIAFAESYAGYMLNSGNYTKEECDTLYDEVEDNALNHEFAHADKEVFLLTSTKIWNSYEKNGWERPVVYHLITSI